MLRRFLLAALVLLSSVAFSATAACLTTLPSNRPFAPRPPYPADPPEGEFWYGTDALWTLLPTNGVWQGSDKQAGYVYNTKLVFWRRGFSWRIEYPAKLTLNAERVDGDAEPFTIDHASSVKLANTQGMMIGVAVPTAGCWEFAVRYHGDSLAFTIWVER
jgi:hypothetical protein